MKQKFRMKDEYFKEQTDLRTDWMDEFIQLLSDNVEGTAAMKEHIKKKDFDLSYKRAMKFV